VTRLVAVAVAATSALVACSAPAKPARLSEPVPAYAPATLAYAGSQACRPCHAKIFARWQRTPMANVVRDPKLHPDAILPDLAITDPLVTFTAADVAFVYGSLWKQRYFTRIGDDLYPLPAQWDVTHRAWRPYHVPDTGAEWWTAYYPSDNLARPTGPLCDGCHSVGYDVETKRPVEWNVGCERCHGPGADHVRAPAKTNIIDPKRLDPVAANDVCIQCHSQGRPVAAPSPGHAYDWPVGYRVGLRLADVWRLEGHDLGATTFTHYADGTGHKNRMQGNDYVQSVMYGHGITCFACHDVHGTTNPAQLVAPATDVCMQCHEAGGVLGPHDKTLVGHTHHADGSPGAACVACHMPRIEQTIGDVAVRVHTFRFIAPSLTDRSGIPNPCTAAPCHADKTTAWATSALRTWASVSPWRVAPD
jgi:predicted CXXCH cytochrome family protein